jgi:hypothetical protein
VLAMGDVREKLVGEPKARDLLGNPGALALYEGDPVCAVAPGEFLDLSE